MKEEKGITLIVLIITIIIILILASIAGFSAIRTMKNVKVTNFVSAMQEVQKKVDLIAESGDYLSIGQSITESGKQTEITNVINSAIENEELNTGNNTNTYISTYTTYIRYFNKEAIKEVFEIDLDDEIIVNFKTREVISLNGIKNGSIIYYTQYKLPNGQIIVQKNPNSTRTPSFDTSKQSDGSIKINSISISNGTLKYSINNEKRWETITNYTKGEATEEYLLSEVASIYEIKLIDNVTGETFTKTIASISLATNTTNIKTKSFRIIAQGIDENNNNLKYTLYVGTEEDNLSQYGLAQNGTSGVSVLWDVTGLTPNTKYYYKVEVTDGEIIIKSTGDVTTLPNTAPTIIASYSNLSASSVTIKSTGTDSDEDTLTYTLKIGSTTYENKTGTTGTEVNWNITGLTMSTTYTYEVGVSDGYGGNAIATGSFTILANTAPVITINTLNSKTTSSFIINVKATDADGDALTYKLYTSTSQNGTYSLKDTVSSVAQNTAKTLATTGLTSGTTYWWYITVYDGIATTQSNKTSMSTDNPNSAPVITINTLNSKTTSSFIINVKATDADGDALTYKLYTSTSQNGTYSLKDTVSSVAQNTAKTLATTGLTEYTTYYWYITVYDSINTTTSTKQNVKTYCSGTGYTCTTSYCSGGTTTAGTICSICDGTGYIEVVTGSCTKCSGSGTVACTGTINTSSAHVACPDCGSPYNDDSLVTRYHQVCTKCSTSRYYYGGMCTCSFPSQGSADGFEHKNINCTLCNGTGNTYRNPNVLNL